MRHPGRFLLFLFLLLMGSASAEAQNKRAQKDYQKGREHVREEAWQEAVEDLRDALQEDPSFSEAYLLLADVYLRLQLPDSALAVYERALPFHPPYFMHYYHGQLLYQQGQYAQAEEALRRYQQHPRANPKYSDEIDRILRSCSFARQAEANPQPYAPQNLGAAVNSEEMEYFPSISADGLTLVFTHRKLSGQKRDEDFWITQRDSLKAPWQKAKVMGGFLNTDQNEGAQTLSADGQVLFFAACQRPDGLGSCDIYASFRQRDGRWGKAINLGPQVNSPRWESQPSISADGRTLFFVRGDNSFDRNLDLYYSEFNGRSWSKARKVPGEVNTQRQETSPYLHFDGRSLYFSSNGHPGMGDLDFFVARKQADGTWGEVENLGYPINTRAQEFSLIVGPDGETGFFSSDALESGLGQLDLYSFSLPLDRRARAVAYLRGKVIDRETRQPVPSRLQFEDVRDSSNRWVQGTNRGGQFYAVLPARADYALSIAEPGYLFYSRNFRLAKQGAEDALYLEVELIPIAAGEKVKLENVFFAFDSYQLKPESTAELQMVLRFLRQNPQVSIVLEGHTDNQGSAAYNEKLSQQRARAVYDYLQEAGIAADRLAYEGYGASQPVADNATEEGRALNRRTVLRISGIDAKD